MIIKTRYRDIPWEEMREGLNPASRDEACRTTWERLRGRPLQILLPAVNVKPTKFCNGPFYEIVDPIHPIGLACPHIAEIGD